VHRHGPEDRPPRAFQNILTRLRRIYDVEEKKKLFPLFLRPFDILYLNGESEIDKPFMERRRILETAVVPLDETLKPALALITDDVKAAQALFKESLDSGNEGLMAKDLNATYTPGVRGKKMVKIKEVLDTLDLAIVSSEWGHGRKAGWLTSFEVAALDENTDRYVVLGRVASGFSDEQLQEMTERLKPLITAEHGRTVDVKPDIIVEVKFQEIQKSPIYSSGYALRFPRLVRVRDDLSPEEVNSFGRVMNIYDISHGIGVKPCRAQPDGAQKSHKLSSIIHFRRLVRFVLPVSVSLFRWMVRFLNTKLFGSTRKHETIFFRFSLSALSPPHSRLKHQIHENHY